MINSKLRIIPCIKINEKKELVCTKNFNERYYIGDPINAVSIFNDFDADELVFIDIDSSKQSRFIDIDYVKIIANEFEHPLIVGGGITNLSQIELLLNSGADRVLLSSSVIYGSEFLKDAVKIFGSSTITVCLDYILDRKSNKNIIFSHKENIITNLDLEKTFLMLLQDGMGECILNSVDRDGLMTGFDLDTIKYFNQKYSNPIISLGGCGSNFDIQKLYEETGCNSVSVGSSFCFNDTDKQVLINYPIRNEKLR